MSGPAKDLFGDPNDAACAECQLLFKGPKASQRAVECLEKHVLERRRGKARVFARTGVSQRGKP